MSKPAADRDSTCEHWEMPTLLFSISLLPKGKAMDSGVGCPACCSTLLQRGGRAPAGKAAHTHPGGKPVPLKQLSKDSNPPSVCKVMPGAFGALVAEGDRPQQPLACTLSGVPHPCCFPSPPALPAYLLPAPSSNWQSLTLMGEHGWAAGLAGAAP